MARTNVFISYTHDSPEHKGQVLALSDRLRQDGLECLIDWYVSGTPPEGWPRWMLNQIEAAVFVLVVCTETYDRRFRGKEEPGKGKGAQWEGVVITQEIYNDAARNTKFVPVFFDADDEKHIPIILQGASYYNLSNEAGYEALYRYLTEQPEVTAPPLGEVRTLPPLERKVPVPPPPERKQPVSEPYGNVPKRNRFFTGREAILNTLHTSLTKQGRAMLSGLGGMGKTQIAIEYAYRHRDDYDHALWVTAETETTLTSGYAHLAHVLDLPQKDEPKQEVIVQAVKTWLEAHDGWLLVFDSANETKLLKPYLPENTNGHLLITSRARQAQRLGLPKGLLTTKLKAREALDFLLDRRGREKLRASEKKAAKALAKELGYLPLALEQAAAYLVENQASFENYLKGYRKRGLDLLEIAGPVIGDYSESVATTWLLNFEQVEAASGAAADLLRASAFLAPDNIPLEIFTDGAERLGPALSEALAGVKEDSLLMDELLKQLTGYSLIRRDVSDRVFNVHGLVQEVVRSSLKQDDQALWAERVMQAVNMAFPIPEFKTWPQCERLLPHARMAITYVKDDPDDVESAGHLFSKIVYYLEDRAKYAEAKPLYRRAALALVDHIDSVLLKAGGDELDIYARLVFVLCRQFDTFDSPDQEKLVGVLEALADDRTLNTDMVLGSIAFNVCAFYDRFQSFTDRCDVILGQLAEHNNPKVVKRVIDGIRHNYPTMSRLSSGKQLAVALLRIFTTGEHDKVWDALPFAVIDHYRELPEEITERFLDQAIGAGRLRRTPNDLIIFINAVGDNYNTLPLDRIDRILEYFLQSETEPALRQALGVMLASNIFYFVDDDGRRGKAREAVEHLLRQSGDSEIHRAIAKALYFHHGTPYEKRIGRPVGDLTVRPYFKRHGRGWINLPAIEAMIDEALDKKMNLRILYYTGHRNSETWREIFPYERYSNPAQGAPWFRGFDSFRNEERKFKLNRIRAIELLEADHSLSS